MTAYETERHFQALEQMVRESGYAVAVLDTACQWGEDYSRARTVYDLACLILRDWAQMHKAEQRVESHIAATYEPNRVAV